MYSLRIILGLWPMLAAFRPSRCPASAMRRGFSLVELLLVMSVIVILIAVAGPALRGLLGTDNRRAAVNQLMGALEQARTTALEKGVNVYVGFAGTGFPEPTWKFTRYIVYRDRSTDLGDLATAPAYVMLTKWQALPIGTVLADFGALPGGIAAATVQAVDGFPPVTSATGTAGANTSFPLHRVGFNSAGAIVEPASVGSLNGIATSGFFVTQGFYTQSGQLQETRRASTGTKLQYDRISLARYTGRARLDPVLDPR